MENKVKHLALEIALRQAMRFSGKSAERTVRNLMELLDTFSGARLPESQRAACRAQLLHDVKEGNATLAIAHLTEAYHLSR